MNFGSSRSDWLLHQFVDKVNKGELRIGITLIVGGVMISGELISGPEYFNALSEQAKDLSATAETLDAANKLAETIKAGASLYVERDSPRHKDNESDIGNFEAEILDIEYLHLKTARVLHTGSSLASADPVSLWRVRLNHVGAFTLYTLNVQSEEL